MDKEETNNQMKEIDKNVNPVKYSTKKEWITASNKARKVYEQIENNPPEYYTFFKKIVSRNQDKFRYESMTPTAYGNEKKDNFEPTIKEWMEFPWKEQQLIWDEVKIYNENTHNIHIDTSRIFAMMQKLKGKKK